MAKRILIVDDEKQLGELVQRSLAKAGHHVIYRNQPEAALQLLRDEPFDVAVTDLRMPGMDGLEFLKRSKKIRPRCEVLMMTGYSSAGILEQVTEANLPVLWKPFTPTALIAQVRDVLDGNADQTPA